MDEISELTKTLIRLRGILVALLFSGIGGIVAVWYVFHTARASGKRVKHEVDEDAPAKNILGRLGKFLLAIVAIASLIIIPPVVFGTDTTGGLLGNILGFWGNSFRILSDIFSGLTSPG